MPIDLLSVVTLRRDIPERGLLRGEMGTVVEILTPDVFEVEFAGEDGRTYATVALKAPDLELADVVPAPALLRKD